MMSPDFTPAFAADRADHLDEAVVLGNLDAQTAELALGLHLHVAEGFRVHVGGVGVEAGEHAVDRVLDQVLVVDRVDVVAMHPLQHVAEQGQQAVGVRPAAGFGKSTDDTKPRAKQPGEWHDRHAGKESGSDQQAGAETPRAARGAVVHLHSFLLRSLKWGGRSFGQWQVIFSRVARCRVQC